MLLASDPRSLAAQGLTPADVGGCIGLGVVRSLNEDDSPVLKQVVDFLSGTRG